MVFMHVSYMQTMNTLDLGFLSMLNCKVETRIRDYISDLAETMRCMVASKCMCKPERVVNYGTNRFIFRLFIFKYIQNAICCTFMMMSHP